MILSFCGQCGTLQPSKYKEVQDPKCGNCNERLGYSHKVIIGEFDDEEANKLLATYHYEQVEIEE